MRAIYQNRCTAGPAARPHFSYPQCNHATRDA